MIETLANQYEPDRVSPPGETLAEILVERQMTQTQLAERTGRTAKFVNEVIKGKASITPRVAIEFQRVLGIRSSFWNNRQRHYDAHLANVRESEALANKLDWAKKFRYREMSKWKWVPETRNKLDRLTSLLDFFGVANPSAWNDVWKSITVNVAYRKSKKITADDYALAAWLRKGELIAQNIECDDYNRDGFLNVLTEIRSLTIKDPEGFVPELTEKCSSCGVAVVFVPELPKTASGATRWLSPSKALIQLSLRYKSDDHLWFTFFHEAAHILFHRKKLLFIEGGAYDSFQAEDNQANRFAANILIPLEEFNSFVAKHAENDISKRSIMKFAQQIGVAPGIVVGRLQHEGILEQSHCNDIKRSLAWVS
jgi:addiction module HigA family antidote